MRTKGSAQELERIRLLAVHRVEEGYSPTDVAEFLEVHERTVWRWVARYREAGEAGVAAKPHPSKSPKLTPPQEKAVLSWIRRNPREFGFPTELWTARRVAELIQRNFRVRFHPRYLSVWLARRRISSQKPQRQARERDEEQIERWRREEFPRILAETRHRNGHLVWLDESGFLLGPLVRRSLAPRGEPPVLKQRAGHRQKVSVISAWSLSPRRQRLGLYYRTFPEGSVRTEQAAAFLRELLRHLRGPVTVIWDRGNNHRGAPLTDLRERVTRLRIERLPPYAPELNPVEYLWSYLKYGKLPNFAPQDVRHLDRVVRTQLRATQRQPRLLQALFRRAPPPIPELALAT